jgi:hypothetical protein
VTTDDVNAGGRVVVGSEVVRWVVLVEDDAVDAVPSSPHAARRSTTAAAAAHRSFTE